MGSPKNNIIVVPHAPYFSLFLRLKIKLKDPPFWQNSGDRGTIAGGAEHDFQDAFRNGRSAGNGAYARKNYFEGDDGQ
jgi:hypothetical protein